MKIVAGNKKAYYNYFITDTVEAGVELHGWEVKSARAGKVNLGESFVSFDTDGGTRSAQAVLKNAHFAPYEYGIVSEQDSRRSRRLLLKRTQIEKIRKSVEAQGMTAVVTKLYFNKRGLLKAEIGVARGKQTYDKKNVIKERDIKREVERAIKDR